MHLLGREEQLAVLPRAPLTRALGLRPLVFESGWTKARVLCTEKHHRIQVYSYYYLFPSGTNRRLTIFYPQHASTTNFASRPVHLHFDQRHVSRSARLSSKAVPRLIKIPLINEVYGKLSVPKLRLAYDAGSCMVVESGGFRSELLTSHIGLAVEVPNLVLNFTFTKCPATRCDDFGLPLFRWVNAHESSSTFWHENGDLDRRHHAMEWKSRLIIIMSYEPWLAWYCQKRSIVVAPGYQNYSRRSANHGNT